MPQAPKSSSSNSEVSGLSLLHPSYSNYYKAKLGDGGAKVTLADRLAERYASRIKKLPAGAFPYTFRYDSWHCAQ